MGNKFKLAVIQMNTGENVESNTVSISKKIAAAAKVGVRLVILPEHADALGKTQQKFETEISGSVCEFYSSLARAHGIYLHCGSITEKNIKGRPYNTSVFFNPYGKQIGIYRKLHMFDVNIENGPKSSESSEVSKGSYITVVNTSLCSVGLAICYDIRFGEMFRLMAKKGAQLFIVCANFTADTGALHWETLLRSRAIENGCFVAAADQCGTNPYFEAWGHSMVIDPFGRIIKQLSRECGVLVCEIDTDLVLKAQSEIPVLKSIRNDIYRLESEHVKIY